MVSSTNADVIAASDFRHSVGALRAGAEMAITEFTVGTDLAACFSNGRQAGATFDQLDAARRTALLEDPVGTPAIVVVGAFVQQALVAMARGISENEFKSREE